ncbi:TauD/TfdA family dioxygenase [Parasphingopyxis marina]|nr:TauD/TfdA family dioxygenase [Parasphingopyxis marina]
MRALRNLADCHAGRPTDQIAAVDFSAPEIGGLILDLQHAVMDGAGAMILRGLDPGSMEAGTFERIFWGLGAQLGDGAIQSAAGERIARVEKREDNPEGRGTLMDGELRPHTDLHEILALACIREAAEGGESMLVSAAALRDAVASRDPEALAALERGYYAGINEAVGGAEPVTREPVPIFSETQGRLSCWYNRFFLAAAARARREEFPEAFARAMAVLDEEAMRPGLGYRFDLAPGDMVFWHNWTCLHARQAFKDGDGRTRLLLRLWLNVECGRPVDPRVAARAAAIDADHAAAFARRQVA